MKCVGFLICHVGKNPECFSRTGGKNVLNIENLLLIARDNLRNSGNYFPDK